MRALRQRKAQKPGAEAAPLHLRQHIQMLQQGPLHRHNAHRPRRQQQKKGFPVLYFFFQIFQLVYIRMLCQKLRRTESLMRGTPAPRIYPGCLTHIFICDGYYHVVFPRCCLQTAPAAPSGLRRKANALPFVIIPRIHRKKQGHLIARDAPVRFHKVLQHGHRHGLRPAQARRPFHPQSVPCRAPGRPQ